MSKGRKIGIACCITILALLIISLVLIIFIMPNDNKKENKNVGTEIEVNNVVGYVQKKYKTEVEKEAIPAKNIINDDKKKALIFQVKDGVNEFPDYIKPKDVIIDKYENFILIYENEKKYTNDYEKLKKDEHTLFVEELKLDDVGMSDKENGEEIFENLSYISELMNVDETVQKIKENNISRKITVGIIDTGLYSENSEIVRYVNTKESYDYVNGDDNVFDGKDNHATMVISSYLEVVGHDVAKNNINIVSAKALENDMGSYYDIYLAIMGMAEKCDIINMSFGGSVDNSLVESAINYATSKNCIMVCAAGNDGGDVLFPARNSKVIAVSAIDNDKKLTDFSNYGKEIDFTAPGKNIECYSIDNKKETVDGTSFSAPIIAGVITLTMLEDETLSGREDVEKYLIERCEDLGDEGKDDKYGNGLPVFEKEALEEENKVYEVDNSNKEAMIEKATELIEKINSENPYRMIFITFVDLDMDGILEFCEQDSGGDGSLYGMAYKFENGEYIEYEQFGTTKSDNEYLKVYKNQDGEYVFWITEYYTSGGATTVHLLKYLNGEKEKLAEYYRHFDGDKELIDCADKNNNLISEEEYNRIIEEARKELIDMNMEYKIVGANDFDIEKKELKDIVKVAYEAYKIGENSDDSQVGTETPTESMSAEKANSILSNYIKNKEYVDLVVHSYINIKMEYAIMDLNADGIPELLLHSAIDAPFYYTWLFALEGETVVLVNENYGYGKYRYSPKYNAILVSPETKPFEGTGVSPFYKLEGKELKRVFSVGEDEGVSFYSDDTGRKTITSEERSAYFDDVVNPEFEKID